MGVFFLPPSIKMMISSAVINLFVLFFLLEISGFIYLINIGWDETLITLVLTFFLQPFTDMEQSNIAVFICFICSFIGVISDRDHNSAHDLAYKTELIRSEKLPRASSILRVNWRESRALPFMPPHSNFFQTHDSTLTDNTDTDWPATLPDQPGDTYVCPV